MIRDRIVVVIRDKHYQSSYNYVDAKLTLEKAKKRVRQCEAIQEQQVTLKDEEAKQLCELLIDPLRNRKVTGK